MRVKNIAFSGFAAAVLAVGAAGAATADTPKIASKAYVDRVQTSVDNLQQTIENQYTPTEDLAGVIATELQKDDSELKAVLDAKADSTTVADLENSVNELKSSIVDKADKIEVTGAQAGNIATVSADGQYRVSDVNLSTLVTEGNVSEKIASALEDSDVVQTAVNNAVDTVIESSISDTNGVLKNALDSKADVDSVYTKEQANALFDGVVPMPEGDCATESNRCVVSYDAVTKKMVWLDVTGPLESAE